MALNMPTGFRENIVYITFTILALSPCCQHWATSFPKQKQAAPISALLSFFSGKIRLVFFFFFPVTVNMKSDFPQFNLKINIIIQVF